MLKGVVIKPLKRNNDERGAFTELLRQDWKDLLGKDWPVQANFSVTYPGMIRAWHRHARGQVDYMVVTKGSLKICVYDEKTGELAEIISSGQDLQAVRVPGKYWHGFKALGDETAFLVYFTTRLFDSHDPDEERRPWDDPAIKPKSINDKKNDPRIRKPWDWIYLAHR
jgi:dTDP-4-dehydrorhamnose 3,5-epimerase